MTKQQAACSCGKGHHEGTGKHGGPIEVLERTDGNTPVTICSDCLLDLAEDDVPNALMADWNRLEEERKALHERVRAAFGPDADVDHYRHYL